MKTLGVVGYTMYLMGTLGIWHFGGFQLGISAILLCGGLGLYHISDYH